MKFDEFLQNAKPPESGDEIAAGLDDMLTVTDLPDCERAAFLTGWTIGVTYVLAKYNEGSIKQAAQQLIQKQGEWSAKDWI